MLIKLRTIAAGAPGSVQGFPGDVVEVDDELAVQLVDAGAAVMVESPTKKEPEDGPATNNTTKRRARKSIGSKRKSKSS